MMAAADPLSEVLDLLALQELEIRTKASIHTQHPSLYKARGRRRCDKPRKPPRGRSASIRSERQSCRLEESKRSFSEKLSRRERSYPGKGDTKYNRDCCLLS